mmetsp:Transcript_5188/g.4768  ORF Transcript_5188/g.4768 Transcript_5188/m.4768 type:complete len:139 (+) Transcript_5188:711-1127(+)
MEKEQLKRECVEYKKKHEAQVSQKEQLRYERDEFHEQFIHNHQQEIENSINFNKGKAEKLAILVDQKKGLVFQVVSGLKHIMKMLVTKGENRSSEYQPNMSVDVASVHFPFVIQKCSQICLILEKKLSFSAIYNEQEL